MVKVRKKPGPPPTGWTPIIGLRLDPLVTAAVDAHIDGTAFKTRSDVIREALHDWLERKGRASD